MGYENATLEQLELDKLTAQAIIEYKEKNKTTITYGELAEAIGVKRDQPMANQGPAHALGRIQKYCDDCDLPILSAMVVLKDQKKQSPPSMPSGGFFDAYEDVRGSTGMTKEELVRIEQEKCLNCSDWQPLFDHIDRLMSIR